MFRIIHFSDLHRTGDDPLTNEELVTGIVNDILQLHQEGLTDFRNPDAIVVSGDIVQGVRSNDPDYPESLQQQYDEALRFLIEITSQLLSEDRSRLILLPGNHDVDRKIARSVMQLVENPAEDLEEHINVPTELTRRDSPLRFCFRTLRLFRITDFEVYNRKLDMFRDTVRKFYYDEEYQGPKPEIQIEPDRRWNNFQLGQNVVITAFDNCQFIDGLRVTADIHSNDIASATMELNSLGIAPSLKIASWHHNFNGPPLKMDYLNSEDLNPIVSHGYRLGLHGHQHKPDVVPHSLFTSSNLEMAVVSVGSLGASDDDLPQGCKQQFNLIEIGDTLNDARIHVREMFTRGVFGAGRLQSRTGESYFDAAWTPAAPNQIVRTDAHGGEPVQRVDEIEQMIRNSRPEKAIQLIEASEDLGDYGKTLLAKAAFDMEDWEKIIGTIVEPNNPSELNILFMAKIKTKDFEGANNLTNTAEEKKMIDAGTARELRKRAAAEKGMNQ